MQDKNGRVGTPTKAVALSSLSLKWPDPDFPRLPGRAHHRSCCCKVATLAWTLGEVSGRSCLKVTLQESGPGEVISGRVFELHNSVTYPNSAWDVVIISPPTSVESRNDCVHLRLYLGSQCEVPCRYVLTTTGNCHE